MYNGIGLQTARGTGTNGYVQSNLSHLMQARRKIEYNGEEDLRRMEAELNKKPNEDIMDHNRKRQVEVKCTEFEMLLEDKGFDEEEIEKKVNEYRKNLLSQLDSGELNVDEELDTRESHARRRAAAKNRDKMRNALGLDEDYVPGSSMAKMNKSDVVGAALEAEPQNDEREKEKLLNSLRAQQKEKKKSKKSKKAETSSSSDSDSDSDSDSSSSSSSSSEDEKEKKKRKRQKRKEMEQRREKLRQKEKELLDASEVKKEVDSGDEKERRRREDRDRRRRSVDRERRRHSPERRRQRSRSAEKRRDRRSRSRSTDRRRRRDSSEDRRATVKKAKTEFEVKQEPLSDNEDYVANKKLSPVRVEKTKKKEKSSKKASSSSSSSSDSGSGSSSSSSSSSSDSD